MGSNCEMIISFADQVTKKIFERGPLTRKEQNKLGGLNFEKAAERLDILNVADERNLLLTSYLKYHKIGGNRYSIDADSRKSKWRITFFWKDEQLQDVEFVKIEDTHRK